MVGTADKQSIHVLAKHTINNNPVMFYKDQPPPTIQKS